MQTDTLFENTQVAFAAKTTAQLQKARVLFSLFGQNKLVNLGTAVTQFALALKLPVSIFFRYTVYEHFCAGETLEDSKETISRLNSFGIASMLNYGVELKETEEDFDKTIAHTLEAIAFAGKNKAVKCICIKLTGFGRFALYEKISVGETLTAAEKTELSAIKKRFRKICEAAWNAKVPLYVDAEESWIQPAMDDLTDEAMNEFNREFPLVFNTFQMYRTDRLDFLKKSLEKARKNGYFLGVKIVRGAYMEKERERADEKGYPSPVFDTKEGSDLSFNEGLDFCFQHLDKISVCIASQSEESCLLAVKRMEKLNIPNNHPYICFSQLYGMGDNITFNFAAKGYNTCKYLPYGPVKEVIPYLIRRAEENSSVQGQMGRELSLIIKELKRRKK